MARNVRSGVLSQEELQRSHVIAAVESLTDHGQLSPTRRRILDLRAAGMTQREIAETLGWSGTTGIRRVRRMNGEVGSIVRVEMRKLRDPYRPPVQVPPV